jgi:hypothetical protein
MIMNFIKNWYYFLGCLLSHGHGHFLQGAEVDIFLELGFITLSND